LKKNLNLVLITVDQMRGDCLGVLGHPAVETPNIDMMARDGYMFTNAYSAVPSCVAARAALFTGMGQRGNGYVGYNDRIPWRYERTLAGELANAGYHTQSVGKMHTYPQRNLCGFHNVVLHDGFIASRDRNMKMIDHWDTTDDYLPWLREQIGSYADMNDSGLDCNSWMARPWPYPERVHPTNWVVHQSIDFLRRRDPDKPFFLNMSFVRPHSPLDPPQVYYDQYINGDIPMPAIGSWAEKDDPERASLLIDAGVGPLPPKALRRMRAAYYALITHIDHQIGRFLITIRKDYHLLNDTVFIFTSDHGDLMCDHNLLRKGVPYEGSSLIPMIIYDPGDNLNGRRGSRYDAVTELRDIMPTFLDIAGADIPNNVEGASLLNFVNGNGANWRGHIHGEHSGGIRSNHYVVTPSEKYIWYSQTGREQYFDMDNDPTELSDLIDDDKYADRADRLRKILIAELAGREEGYSDGMKLYTGRKPQDYLYKEMGIKNGEQNS